MWVEIHHARITSCTTSPLSLASRRESARVAGGIRNAVPTRQRLLRACLSRAPEQNGCFRDRRKGSARERGPLPVGCPPRTYHAGCVSTVVSHGLRGWLGESVPQQSVRRRRPEQRLLGPPPQMATVSLFADGEFPEQTEREAPMAGLVA